MRRQRAAQHSDQRQRRDGYQRAGDHVGALEKTIQRLRDDLGPEGARRIQTTAEGYELIG